MRMKFLNLSILLILPYLVMSQNFGGLGLNPTKMKWEQINTDKVQVIYPQGLEPKAQRAANIIHLLYDSSHYALGDKKEKISIILQNQTTVSNGFVSPIGPVRSEFFITPPQFSFLGNVDWWDALTIHEYRHVQQFHNSKRGITKAASILFGENGWGGASVLAMPRWFFEGDAVFFETQLTNAGRGKTPDFDKQYRSLMLSNRFYDYEKASAFSLRDFVPNHYSLGYYLTTHIRQKYGEDAFVRAAQEATAYKGWFPIYPYSNALKRQTGKRVRGLYTETFQELQEEWKQESLTLDLTPSQQVNPLKKKTVTNYQLPVFLSENDLIAEKRGFQHIRTLIAIDKNGEEKRIVTPGLASDNNSTLSVGGGKIAWIEMAYDERWGNQDFSIIKTYDLDTRERRKITHRSKYFAPNISSDGTKIVAVEVSESAKYSLHVLDASSGQILQVLPNEENLFFSFPKWMEDGRIIAVAQKNSKNALVLIDPEDRSTEILTPFQVEQISYPEPYESFIFFTNTITGIDNIHVWDMSESKEYQVTSTLLGATQAAVSPNGSQLAFSEFTAEGWNIKTMEMKPGAWRELKENYETTIDFYASSSRYGNILENVPETVFTTKKFNKVNGLFNLHSWSPIAVHPEYGGGIFVANKLSTLSGSAFYQYNINENTGSWSANVSYAELYPVINVGYRRGDRSRNARFYREDRIRQVGSQVFRTVDWVEDDIEVGVTLPINIAASNHFGDLSLSTNYHYLNVDFDDREEGTDETFSAMEVGLDFSRFQTRARQQVLPRWGQFFSVSYLRTLDTDINETDYFQANGRLILPGIARTHATSLRAGYRREDSESSYKFRDLFPYARGYGSVTGDEIWVLGVQYSFPIWLPDLPLGPFIFIKRLKGGPFFDISQSTLNRISDEALTSLGLNTLDGEFPEITSEFKSVGFDLRFDFRFLRLLDADVGVRYAYLIDDVGSDRHKILPIVAAFSF